MYRLAVLFVLVVGLAIGVSLLYKITVIDEE